MVTHRPVILAVDDEPSDLAALLDALVRRYGADYRVTSQLSAAAALKDLARMRDEGEPVALVIADQWMPEMNGIDLLGRAHEIHPSAQRALLVHWGDQTAAYIFIGTVLEPTLSEPFQIARAAIQKSQQFRGLARTQATFRGSRATWPRVKTFGNLNAISTAWYISFSVILGNECELG
jgi:DNA-binding NtrC family response regulator